MRGVNFATKKIENLQCPFLPLIPLWGDRGARGRRGGGGRGRPEEDGGGRTVKGIRGSAVRSGSTLGALASLGGGGGSGGREEGGLGVWEEGGVPAPLVPTATLLASKGVRPPYPPPHVYTSREAGGCKVSQ